MWMWLGRVLLRTEQREYNQEAGEGDRAGASHQQEGGVVPKAHSQALQPVLGTRWKGSFQGSTTDLLNQTCRARMGSSLCLHRPQGTGGPGPESPELGGVCHRGLGSLPRPWAARTEGTEPHNASASLTGDREWKFCFLFTFVQIIDKNYYRIKEL